MKNFLIGYNRIDEIEGEVDKKIIENSIVYTGFTIDGEKINAYDTENGKLAPIVRFLIEDEQGSRNYFKMIIFIFIFIIIIGLSIYWFYPKDEKVNNSIITPIVKEAIKKEEIKPEIKEEKKEEIKENTGSVAKVSNEIQLLDLKNQAELQSLKLNFDIQALNIENKKLTDENKKLIDENILLKQNIKILEEKKARELKSPNDQFIYYLGDKFYNNCENSKDQKVKNSCKDLYYNFLKNDGK